jgi:clathrin heavy chain
MYFHAASRCGNMHEVERVGRVSTHCDPVEVKDFAKENKLADPRPIICVCGLHGFVTELTECLC